MVSHTWIKQVAEDGVTLWAACWQPEGAVKGVVFLLHGMAEHPLRYAAVAQAHLRQGLAVVAPAHRGHGRTGHGMGQLGHFSDENGWARVLKDLEGWREQIETLFPQCPVLLAGHSMGSFLARCHLGASSHSYVGVALCGTGFYANLKVRVFAWIARAVVRFKGSRHLSPLILALGRMDQLKGVAHPRTPADWLSRCPESVDRYLADPDCGFDCTAGFYRDLLKGWIQMSQVATPSAERVRLPLAFFSGQADPVGGWGRGVLKAAEAYTKAGYTAVSVRLYPGARHELFHEINREQVLADWTDFVGRCFGVGSEGAGV